eukprot:11746688-Alexandrium_andersonii.AAC.1
MTRAPPARLAHEQLAGALRAAIPAERERAPLAPPPRLAQELFRAVVWHLYIARGPKCNPQS